MRDAQRARLYRAEQAVRSDGDVRFTSVGEAQEWLDTVLRPAFADPLPLSKKVTVRLGTNPKTSYAVIERGDLFIDLSPNLGGWAWCGMVVAHELAHHLNRLLNLPSHGAEFARSFLSTVQVYDAERAKDLAVSFDTHKVIHDPWHQWNAARDQVSRLRSDVGLMRGKDPHVLVPFKVLVYAGDSSDFTGSTYHWEYHTSIEPEHTKGHALRLPETFTQEARAIAWSQLRYVEGAMIRPR